MPGNKQLSDLLMRIRREDGTLNEHRIMEETAKHPRNNEEPSTGYATFSNLGFNNSKLDFIITFTTPKLMQKLQNQKFLQVDATFKTTWMGFPLLVAGFSDANRKFYPTMLAIVSREYTSAYEKMFEEIKHFEENEYIPEYVMADGAASITHALNSVFGIQSMRLMCYFHVVQRIKNKVKEFKLSEEDIRTVLDDIEILRAAPNTNEFWLG